LNPILDKGSLVFQAAFSKDKTIIISPKATDQVVKKFFGILLNLNNILYLHKIN
jgi:hypothetical protein